MKREAFWETIRELKESVQAANAIWNAAVSLEDSRAAKYGQGRKEEPVRSQVAERNGSLMEKTVYYLNHFWNQVFLYRKDENYTIDNSLAERCIRPLVNERKNSLFFGGNKIARVSAA